MARVYASGRMQDVADSRPRADWLCCRAWPPRGRALEAVVVGLEIPSAHRHPDDYAVGVLHMLQASCSLVGSIYSMEEEDPADKPGTSTTQYGDDSTTHSTVRPNTSHGNVPSMWARRQRLCLFEQQTTHYEPTYKSPMIQLDGV